MVSWVSWLMEKLVIFSVPLAKLWGPPCHSTAHQTLSRARTFSDTLEMSLTSVVLLKLGEHVLINVATYKLDQINILNSMFFNVGIEIYVEFPFTEHELTRTWFKFGV